MKIIDVNDVREIITKHGFENLLRDLMDQLKSDFKNWDKFNKVPRPAMHVKDGVLELMPICDEKFHSFKFVNCHPKNPNLDLLTVVATGQLSDVATGYPLMFSEMTLLTAFRTAATTAIATDYMSRKDSKILAIIGTGAQSEFLLSAMFLVRDIEEVRYFDTDEKAMEKFQNNTKNLKFKFVKCLSAEQAVQNADIVTTCTACKNYVDVIKCGWLKKGVHINGIGGDCPGKTEMELEIVKKSRVVVEYFEQSFIEGEIQRFDLETAKKLVVAELHELVKAEKMGRLNDSEVTLYDSVGIALEDYSVLTLVYKLAKRYNLGHNLSILPNLADPKNLFSLV
jgi:ornithine cyclodeaminase